jgi:hypothetical protein
MRIKLELQGKGYGRDGCRNDETGPNEGLKELYFSTYFDNLASIKSTNLWILKSSGLHEPGAGTQALRGS